MNVDASDGQAAFNRKQAEALGRFFNMTFNSALLYGGQHQSTSENAAVFFSQLEAVLAAVPMVTMLIERESVFFESFCVDKIVNSRRITAYCKKAGIQSLSFKRGITHAQVREFARIIGDNQEAPSAEELRRLMTGPTPGGIRVNYVVYRKVSADEAVVDKQRIAADLPASIPLADSAPGIGVTPEVSLKSMIENPAIIAGALRLGAGDEPGPVFETIADQLRTMAGRIRAEGVDGEPLSAPALAEAIAFLRADMAKSMGLLKAMGKLSAHTDPVTEELDNLSRETVIRIIRDEYRHGSVSVKRLAQIIRRILPHARELKPLLPRLRAALTEDGMPLIDFLQLVNSLIREIDDEELTAGLSRAAEEMGLSADEIVAGIKTDPAEAARLIVLASELRAGPGGGERLSSVLAEYVEQAGRKLAVSPHENADGAAPGRETMENHTSQVLDALGKAGVDGELVKRVAQKVSHPRRGFELPKGIFDIKVTAFFLDHEIKRYLRYNTPFSTIVISCAGLGVQGASAVITAAHDAARIIPATLTAVKKMLRDLDLVGVMGWISDNVPFIVLPMTDEEGAQSVKKRLQRELGTIKISDVAGSQAPIFTVTAHTFDRSKTPDRDSFIKMVRDIHGAEVQRVGGMQSREI